MLHSHGGQSTHGGALVAFTDSSRDNFDKWKESIDRLLGLHPDDLLHVALHRRFSVTVLARRTQLLKSADIGADKLTSTLAEALADANGNLYRIILGTTLSHTTTHMAAQRLYGTPPDGEKLYKHLLGMWTTSKARSRKELIRKDLDRAKHIARGIEGPSISHVELFVEKLLSINTERDGTDMERKPPTLAMHGLEAAHEHHPAFIDGLEGRHAGEKPDAWMANFDTFWAELHSGLLNHRSTRDDCARDADVLATATSTPSLAGLEAQISALAEHGVLGLGVHPQHSEPIGETHARARHELHRPLRHGR